MPGTRAWQVGVGQRAPAVDLKAGATVNRGLLVRGRGALYQGALGELLLFFWGLGWGQPSKEPHTSHFEVG